MRFIIDGRIDVRPQNSSDIPNIALPFDNASYEEAIVALADGVSANTIFNSSDHWGITNTLFLEAFTFNIGGAGDFISSAGEGIVITIDELDAAAGATIINRIYTGQWVNPVNNQIPFGALRLFAAYVKVSKTKIDQPVIRVNIINGSGASISGTCHLIGTPVASSLV